LFSRAQFLDLPGRRVPRGFFLIGLSALLGLGHPVHAYPNEPVTLPEFSGERAMELLTAQCDLGPRFPGSPGHLQLREMIVEFARAQGFRSFSLCFEAADPQSREPVQACNIVVPVGPAGGERLWLGAHYDTRPRSDHDPDQDKRTVPLTGANDGASGVAVLLHLMEIMSANPPPGGVDFLFFDLEDSGLAGDPLGFCLGSGHLAATREDFGNPLAQVNPRGLIVLDMVGKKNLQIPMEGYSLVNAPAWTATVFDRADQLGLAAFLPAKGPAVYDDHVPFLQQGIPAVDLIDFDFPQWHTTADTPDHCSSASLAEVGLLMVDLIYRP
jgi:glutaminyl-peptide cyclotransferase